MPVFEFEKEGQTYEVDAPSQDLAIEAFGKFGPSPPPEKKTESSLESVAPRAAAQLDPDIGSRLASRFRGTKKVEPFSAPIGVQIDVAGAENPEETRKALEKHYPAEDISQDKRGRWHVNIEGKDRVVEPEFLSRILATTPESAGGIIGGVAGSALGPAGTVGGAALGGAAGRGISESLKYLRGLYASEEGKPESNIQSRIGRGAVEQGAFSAIPIVGSTLGRGVAQFLRRQGGISPETAERAGRLVRGGAMPPVRSVAPEFEGTASKQELSTIVSYGGKFQGTPLNVKWTERRMKETLLNEGLSEQEADNFMSTVANPQAAVSTAEAGEGIVATAQQRVADINSRIDGELSTARGALKTSEENMRRLAQAPPELGRQVWEAIQSQRSAFGQEMSRAYQEVHDLTGAAPVFPMGDAIGAAQGVVDEMSEAPMWVPSVVRDLVKRKETIDQARAKVAELEAGGKPVPDKLREIADRDYEFATIEEAHNLRSALREAMRQKSVRLTPEQQYALLSRVEDAVDDSFAALADTGAGLPAEAAQALRKVDVGYREGIAIYKNAALNKLVRDSRDGLPVDPYVVARTIAPPGHSGEARAILSMLPTEVRTNVAKADLGERLMRSGTLDPVTGQNILDGKRLLQELNRDQDITKVLYKDLPGALDDLRQLASEYAALDGHLELSAVRPSSIREQIARANVLQRDAEAFTESNPLASLASTDPHVVDMAVRKVAQPGNERETELAMRALGEKSPEWEKVRQTVLKQLFAGTFREDVSGAKLLSGEYLTGRLARYTPRQQEMLLPNGLGDDIRKLAKDIQFLFPKRIMALAGDYASSQAAKAVTSKSYINPLGLHKRIYWFAWDWMLRRPATMRFLVDQIEMSPSREYTKKLLGMYGRLIFGTYGTGPSHQQERRKRRKEASAIGDLGYSTGARDTMLDPREVPDPSRDTFSERFGAWDPLGHFIDNLREERKGLQTIVPGSKAVDELGYRGQQDPATGLNVVTRI